jgi:hypothetical protein
MCLFRVAVGVGLLRESTRFTQRRCAFHAWQRHLMCLQMLEFTMAMKTDCGTSLQPPPAAGLASRDDPSVALPLTPMDALMDEQHTWPRRDLSIEESATQAAVDALLARNQALLAQL